MPEPGNNVGDAEWFRRAFDDFYASLYAHRDETEAERLIATLVLRFRLSGPFLDVACGPGRFLRVLRGRGERAFGVDLSRPLLARARENLGRSSPPLALADMRSLPIRRGSMRSALLLFTSFGYFAHEPEDQTVLREVAGALGEGGYAVLDFLNAVTAVRDLVPESERKVSGRSVQETRWVDPTGPFLRKRVRIAAVTPGRPEMIYEERVRLYTAPELRSLMERAGLAVEAALGDYEGSSFTEASSPRCLLLARKREGG